MNIFTKLIFTFSIVYLINNQILSAFIIKNNNYSQISLLADGQNIDLRQSKDSDSWLQMVLVFGKTSTGNSIKEITNVLTPEIAIVPECPSEFIRIGSFCYFFSKTVSNWFSAFESCKSKGADLAHPITEEKNTQLVDYIKKNFPTVESSWWLGASDLAEEGIWRWAHDNSGLSFTNWLNSQPDNAKDGEDCLSYWTTHNWGWNDLSSNKDSAGDSNGHLTGDLTENLNEILTGDLTKILTADITKLTEAILKITKQIKEEKQIKQIEKCLPEFIRIGSFCYFFGTTKSNWFSAYGSCKSKGAELAHPSTKEKDTQLINYVNKNFPTIEYWWIGGSDLAEEGIWTWTHDNSRISFTNWLKGQPDNGGKHEHCLHYGKSSWNDWICDIQAQYICEQNSRLIK
ncbi:Fc fragment of IgE, low affinity II, receptor for (CD23) [Chamberlinius hualienensis]